MTIGTVAIPGGIASRPDAPEFAALSLQTLSSSSSLATAAHSIVPTLYSGLAISSLSTLLITGQSTDLALIRRQGQQALLSRPHIGTSQPLEPAAAGYRSRELEWRRGHEKELQSFAGQWVVLQDERIVAADTDPVKLVASARAQGIVVPYVFYVEPVVNEDTVKIGI